MNTTNAEEVKKHVALYLKIGFALLILTAVTVAVSYLPFGVPLAITVALIIAIGKSSLVATVFMHLIEEKKTIYFALLLTLVFFLVLIAIPLLGLLDTYGRFIH